MFGELQSALDTVWDVEPRPDRGWLATVRARFLSVTMVLGTGFLLLVSLVLTTVLSRVSGWLGTFLPGGTVVAHVLSFVVSFAGVAGLFAMIFKWLPDAVIAWRDVAAGAILTALLFAIGKAALGIYLGHANLASGFGAAGSLILILVWVYYSAQIFLYGAELTQVWARRRGARVRPAPDARRTRDAATARPLEPERPREPARSPAPMR